MNLAELLCDRHARTHRERPALLHEHADGRLETYSFGRIAELSRRCASALRAHGIGCGDRVALLMGQAPEMPIVLLACWRLGAIAVPIAPVFAGPGLQHRLRHSCARAVVSDRRGCTSVLALRDALGDLQAIWSIDPPDDSSVRSLHADIARATPLRDRPTVDGNSPAYIMYTSGTTGQAKGAVHSHAGFQATLPGAAMIHDNVEPTDIAWSPAAWSWIAGFGGMLLYFLYAGRPIVAWTPPHPFDPEQVLSFMARRHVRNTLLTPTMLRMMNGIGIPKLALRTMLCTGEPVSADLSLFCEERLGVVPCEAYGQTECAPIAVNNPRLMPKRPGALGRAVPGMRVDVVSSSGEPLACGDVGEIAVGRDHPSLFQGYWRDAATTAEKLSPQWLMTGDEGWRDEEGFLWFLGRRDDVIKSSGYRIGPGEIESCLGSHPAVELIAAVGLTDPTRGSTIVAAVKLKAGHEPSETLVDELLALGKLRLERHEQPRRIVFLDDMPLTVTGKVMRKKVKELLEAKPLASLKAGGAPQHP